jgi:CxxC motif-containing protein
MQRNPTIIISNDKRNLTFKTKIRKVMPLAPVKMDQMVIENVLGTGIDMIASRDFK